MRPTISQELLLVITRLTHVIIQPLSVIALHPIRVECRPPIAVEDKLSYVIALLDRAIHMNRRKWIPGSSPRMTEKSQGVTKAVLAGAFFGLLLFFVLPASAHAADFVWDGGDDDTV